MKKLKALLLFILTRIQRKEISLELSRRVEEVGKVLYKYLPDMLAEIRTSYITDPEYVSEPEPIVVIEHGSFNYFKLSNNKIPKFDYVCPQIPLYVYIGGPESASSTIATALGVSAEDWTNEQSDLDTIRLLIPKLTSNGQAVEPKLLIITWDQPCSEISISKRLHEVLNGT